MSGMPSSARTATGDAYMGNTSMLRAAPCCSIPCTGTAAAIKAPVSSLHKQQQQPPHDAHAALMPAPRLVALHALLNTSG